MKHLTERQALALHQAIHDAIYVIAEYAADSARLARMHAREFSRPLASYHTAQHDHAVNVNRRLRASRALLADTPRTPADHLDVLDRPHDPFQTSA